MPVKTTNAEAIGILAIEELSIITRIRKERVMNGGILDLPEELDLELDGFATSVAMHPSIKLPWFDLEPLAKARFDHHYAFWLKVMESERQAAAADEPDSWFDEDEAWEQLSDAEKDEEWDSFHSLCQLGIGDDHPFYNRLMRIHLQGYVGH